MTQKLLTCTKGLVTFVGMEVQAGSVREREDKRPSFLSISAVPEKMRDGTLVIEAGESYAIIKDTIECPDGNSCYGPCLKQD